MTEFWWTLACGVVLAATSLALGYIIGWDRGHQKAVDEFFAREEEVEQRVHSERVRLALQSVIEQRRAEHAARTQSE
jgi:hypothetical protein